MEPMTFFAYLWSQLHPTCIFAEMDLPFTIYFVKNRSRWTTFKLSEPLTDLPGKYWQNLWDWRCSGIWLPWAGTWWQFSGGRWQLGWSEEGWISAGWWESFPNSGDGSEWCYRWRRGHQPPGRRGRTHWSDAAEGHTEHRTGMSWASFISQWGSLLWTGVGNQDSVSELRLNPKWLKD